MSAPQMDTFGFELLQELYKNDVLKKEDAIVLLAHWYLIRCGFKCVGFGDSRVLNASDKRSELLPSDWSKNGYYALRYVKEDKLYILHGTKSDEDLLFNFLRIEDRNVSNVQFSVGQSVTEDLHSPLEHLMPGYQAILKTIQNDLIEPMVPNNTNESGTQTVTTEPYRERIRRLDPHFDLQRRPPDGGLGNIGRADLDPFAPRNIGGGMLFDPFDQRRRNIMDPLRPGGSLDDDGFMAGPIPPGARHDPLVPPDPNVMPRPRSPSSLRSPPSMPFGSDDMYA